MIILENSVKGRESEKEKMKRKKEKKAYNMWYELEVINAWTAARIAIEYFALFTIVINSLHKLRIRILNVCELYSGIQLATISGILRFPDNYLHIVAF